MYVLGYYLNNDSIDLDGHRSKVKYNQDNKIFQKPINLSHSGQSCSDVWEYKIFI